MNIDGTYVVHFAYGRLMMGGGTVEIKNGQLLGSDESFQWSGTYSVAEGMFRAELNVSQTNQRMSLFGMDKTFDLILSGPADASNMSLKGYRPEFPNDEITIILVRDSGISPPMFQPVVT